MSVAMMKTRNGKLTKKAKLIRIYRAGLNGRTNRHYMSYLMRLLEMNEVSVMDLLYRLTREYGIKWEKKGQCVSFIYTI